MSILIQSPSGKLANSSSLPNLRVLTLNTWGIKYMSKDVDQRLNYLIDALNEQRYDIVALQEVWSYSNYLKMKEKLATNYPFSYYFRSGLIGSGCCVFSKHCIESSMCHRYTLSGYPYKVQHGDWYGGKLVGLVVIRFHRIQLNVYATHLHANYSADFRADEFADEYLPHRLSQLFELSQFVNETSHAADMCLLLGDLNTCDDEPGYELLRGHSGLLDAFKEKPFNGNSSKLLLPEDMTCHTQGNYYTRLQSAAVHRAFPDGLRLDYVMYKCRRQLDVKCVEYKVCMGKIPNSQLSYSDHEGVRSEFQITTDGSTCTPVCDFVEPTLEHYKHAQFVMQRAANAIQTQQTSMFIAALVTCVALLLFNYLNPLLAIGGSVGHVLIALLVVYTLVYVVFIKMSEKRSLQCVGDTLQLIAASLKSKMDSGKFR